MKSSVSSHGQVSSQNQVSQDTSLNVVYEGILYGYLNFESFNPETGKWSLSLNAMTIKVSKDMMDNKFNVSTEQIINIKALLNCCISGAVPDGTVLEEGWVINPFNLEEKIQFRRVWRRNTSPNRGPVSTKPTWTLPTGAQQ